MAKSENKTNDINISAYSFSRENNPDIIESASTSWIQYGDDNQYPQLLIDKYRKSAVHNALVNGISKLIAGEEFLGWYQDRNSRGETINDIVNKTAFDLKLNGYYTLQCIWNITGTRVEVIHQPAEQVRSGKADEFGKVHNYYIHKDWVNTTGKNAPKRIHAWNPNKRKEEPRQLLFIKRPQPGQFYYSHPDYIGAMNYISLDDEISEFHLNNIQNGFFPSTVIQLFRGEPDAKTQREVEAKFKAKFAGAKGNKLAFVYNSNKNQKIEFDTFEPANLDERFKNLGPQVTEKIMIAHNVTTPLLFGIKSGTGFGNNAEEMQTGLAILNSMVIKPYQDLILRGFEQIQEATEFNNVLEIRTIAPDGLNTQLEARMQMSSRDDREEIPESMIEDTLDQLDELGESENLTDFDIVDVPENIPDNEVGDWLQKNHAFAIQSDPTAKSTLDKGLFKIRYKYSGPRDGKNRDFCRKVLDKNLIYRKEDINQMSFRGENSEFGTYSIFKYKGSYNCRHRWQRLVYFRKRNTNGQFLPDSGLKNEKRVSVNNPEYSKPNDVNATKVNQKVQK